jgi:serine/threonine-protein kinase
LTATPPFPGGPADGVKPRAKTVERVSGLSDERWRAVSPHLDRALDLTGPERTLWLASLEIEDPALAAELSALLQEADAVQREGYLEAGAVTPPASLAGLAIGAYTLISLIGAGGMGTVWLARRSDGRFEGEAAVKLLNPSLIGHAGEERFSLEGSILARLRHPHIAQLIDAGVSGLSQPYLVLEYVDGERIDAYCDGRKLEIEARIRLFLDVLAAVSHAHANLIVHRDLKPSNVLVGTDGRVKLLDFGIAKLLERDLGAGEATALTREGAVLTPEYAAPEQLAGGHVTTATDVYALGVLLYVLLAGRHPISEGTRSTAELLRAVLEKEPARLSETFASSGKQAPAKTAAQRSTPAGRLRRLLRGDLDTIVAKALKKDPAERYASVAALADDLRRHLDHQPIGARPDALAYRAAKFVRRNRAPVALTALTLLALAGGLVGTITQARRATRQAAIAGEQAARAEAVRDFLFEVFDEAQPGTAGRPPPTVLEVVKDAVRAARANRGMNALARTELLTQLGGVIGSQGDVAASRTVLEETFSDAERRLGRHDQATLLAGKGLAEALMNAGEHDRARSLLDDLRQRTPDDLPAVQARLLTLSAYLHSLRMEKDPSLAEAAQAVGLCRRSCEPDDLSDALTALANAQNVFNAPEASAATWEEILVLERQRYGPSHIRVASTLAGLSRPLRKVGQLERAEASVREALAIDDAVLDRNDGRRQNHLNALMMVLRARRDYPGALETSRESLRVARAVYGEEHPEVAVSLNSVGFALTVLGDYRGAADPLREALGLREKTYGPENLQTAAVRANYGDALARAGEAGRGVPEMRHAIASYQRSATRDPEGEVNSLEKLARWYLDSNEATSALKEYERVGEAARALGPRASPWPARVRMGRGRSLLLLGRFAEAAAALDDAARLAAEGAPDPEQAVEIQWARALLAARQDHAAEARALAADGLTALAALAHPPARLRAFAEQVRRQLGLATALAPAAPVPPVR